MEDDTVNLIGVQKGIGEHIANDSRKDKRVSSVLKQYDHQEGFFFNRLVTDFEPIALTLNDFWRRCRVRLKHESGWCFKVIFNCGSWVSIRSNGIGVEERHPLNTLLAARGAETRGMGGYIPPIV